MQKSRTEALQEVNEVQHGKDEKKSAAMQY